MDSVLVTESDAALAHTCGLTDCCPAARLCPLAAHLRRQHPERIRNFLEVAHGGVCCLVLREKAPPIRLSLVLSSSEAESMACSGYKLQPMRETEMSK